MIVSRSKGTSTTCHCEEAVPLPVIASQCAHWRGNPFPLCTGGFDGNAQKTQPLENGLPHQSADWFAMTGKLDELSQHIITGIWLIEQSAGSCAAQESGDHRRAEAGFRHHDGRFHRGAEMQLRGTFALDKLPHTLKRAMIMYYKCEKPSIPLPRDRWFSAC